MDGANKRPMYGGVLGWQRPWADVRMESQLEGRVRPMDGWGQWEADEWWRAWFAEAEAGGDYVGSAAGNGWSFV